MTAASASERVAHRWWAWLDQVGRSSRAHDRQVVDRSTTPVAEGAPQLSVREVFVCADLPERRSLDLLLAVFVELEAAPGSGRLHIVGPEALRARSVAGSAGFVISELGFGPVTPDARVHSRCSALTMRAAPVTWRARSTRSASCSTTRTTSKDPRQWPTPSSGGWRCSPPRQASGCPSRALSRTRATRAHCICSLTPRSRWTTTSSSATAG